MEAVSNTSFSLLLLFRRELPPRQPTVVENCANDGRALSTTRQRLLESHGVADRQEKEGLDSEGGTEETRR